MLMRGFRFALIAVATAMAIYSVITAATAYPDSAMGFTSEGTAVAYVLPGGPVWRDGVRAGDVVVSLQDGASAGGWELVAEGSGGLHLSNWSSHLAQLRGTVDIALMGAIVVLAASVLLLRPSPWGAALIPIAVGLTTVPLLRTGNLGDLLLAGPGVFLVAGASIVAVAARTTSRAGIGLLVALAAVLAAAWVLAIRVVPVAFDVFDVLRLPLLAVVTLLAAIMVTDRRRLLHRLSEPSGTNPLDLVYLPGVLVLALVGLLVLDLPLVPVLAGAAVLVLVYPAARRTTARVVERALIGDVRRQAELRAIEQERGRLARDIHDAPLQELAAVIRRLDARPDTPTETAALRQVAAQLRDVVTTLRPPVLEDLGLVAALEDLGDALAAANPLRAVTVQVDDLQVPGHRLDPDLETSVFRIVQQACANSIQHSNGTTLRVEGSVASDAIDLIIVDDGSADTESASVPTGLGHFGLDSMRDRAASVGGHVGIERTAGAYTVRFRWEAQA